MLNILQKWTVTNMTTIFNFEATSNKFSINKIYTYVINSSLNPLLLNILSHNIYVASMLWAATWQQSRGGWRHTGILHVLADHHTAHLASYSGKPCILVLECSNSHRFTFQYNWSYSLLKKIIWGLVSSWTDWRTPLQKFSMPSGWHCLQFLHLFC